MLKRIVVTTIALWLLLATGGGAMTVTYQLITPDGTTFNLTGTGLAVRGIEGWGMPTVAHKWRQVPQQDGGVLDAIRAEPRVITITEHVYGSSRSNMHTLLASVMSKTYWERTSTLQPLRLRYTVGATSADLYCYYAGEIREEAGAYSRVVGIRLVAYDPYWYATSETSTSGVSTSESINARGLFGRVSGEWSALDSTGGIIYAMTTDANGDIYIGGLFTNWAGDADADNIARYDISNGTWHAVGTGTNAAVYAIAVAPNGDIYIGGAFTNAGGDADADYIAVLRSGGSDWEAVVSAGTPFDDYVWTLCLTNDNYLWAGGAFTSAGGTASNLVARMELDDPDVWIAATGMPAATFVLSIVQGADGTIYAGGAFANASADADADNLAYWTGSAWANVGGALNSFVEKMQIGPEGFLYICGDFTDWGGESVSRVAYWDGSAVHDMDGGVNAEAYSMWVDSGGQVYLGGTFTTAGDYTVYRAALWNGTMWIPPPFSLSGTPGIRAIYGNDDGDLFFGLTTTVEVTVPASTSVTNSGTVISLPRIEITGPGTIRSIRNETTGVEILSDIYAGSGETITVDLGEPGEIPGQISVDTDWDGRPNKHLLLGKVLVPSELGQFGLAPAPIATSGVNLINIYVERATTYELLSNRGFETAGGGGADIWANWGETAGDGALANETVIVYEGNNAARITAGPSANTFVTQTFAVVPAQRYILRFWTRGDGTNAGRYLVYDNTNADYILVHTSTGVTGETYTLVTYEFVTPAGCVSALVRFSCPAANGGIAYFDFASVHRMDGTIKHYNRYLSVDDAVG